MDEKSTYFLYPAQKVIEDTQKEADLSPVRLFAVLFPLWRVTLEGTFREQKPYALLEEYLERGIFEGDYHTVEELSAFFGIDSRLIAKVLDFLQTIEHVQYEQGRWQLRPLGQDSLREGQKYIAKKSRQEIFFEAFQRQPLTREHYEKLQVYTEQETEELVALYEHSNRGYRCERLFSFHEWNSSAIDDLSRRSDRDRYNLRKELGGIHQASQPEQVYLPLYLIEARKKNGQRTYLAYSRIRGRRDLFFEGIVNKYPDICESLAIAATNEQQNKDLWTQWLKRLGLSNVQPLRMPNGIWQLNLSAELLRMNNSLLPIDKIGTYRLERGYFLYIWCDDVEIRRNAVLERVLNQVEHYKKTITEREIEKNLLLLSEQLVTRKLDLSDLKRRARETRRADLLSIIDAL